MKKLSSFVLVTVLASAAGGCVVHTRARVEPVAVVEVEEEPPPPRTVVVQTRPGFVWVEGRWYRRGGRWEWADGRWERERGGHVWVQGHWERRGRGHVWIDGHWQQGGPVVRDHRR